MLVCCLTINCSMFYFKSNFIFKLSNEKMFCRCNFCIIWLFVEQCHVIDLFVIWLVVYLGPGSPTPQSTVQHQQLHQTQQLSGAGQAGPNPIVSPSPYHHPRSQVNVWLCVLQTVRIKFLLRFFLLCLH